MQLHETVMGRRLIDHDIPNISKELEKQNLLREKELELLQKLIATIQKNGNSCEMPQTSNEDNKTSSVDNGDKTTENAKKFFVTAFPYTAISGYINVPKEVYYDAPGGPYDLRVREYITDHFDEIKFMEPDIDFCGCCFEFVAPALQEE